MFENLINLRKIKNYSIEFIKELRFKSKYLYIYTKSGYCSFSKIESFESLGNDEIIPITLEDILLDTGNSTDYCLIAKEFEEPINRIFFNNELEFEFPFTYRIFKLYEKKNENNNKYWNL
ncbi:MAG: hypothetical protein ACTSQS_04760 [Promethearchaeota archaeon]